MLETRERLTTRMLYVDLFWIAHSRPSITSLTYAMPLSSETLTLTSPAPGAIPNVLALGVCSAVCDDPSHVSTMAVSIPVEGRRVCVEIDAGLQHGLKRLVGLRYASDRAGNSAVEYRHGHSGACHLR